MAYSKILRFFHSRGMKNIQLAITCAAVALFVSKPVHASAAQNNGKVFHGSVNLKDSALEVIGAEDEVYDEVIVQSSSEVVKVEASRKPAKNVIHGSVNLDDEGLNVVNTENTGKSREEKPEKAAHSEGKSTRPESNNNTSTREIARDVALKVEEEEPEEITINEENEELQPAESVIKAGIEEEQEDLYEEVYEDSYDAPVIFVDEDNGIIVIEDEEEPVIIEDEAEEPVIIEDEAEEPEEEDTEEKTVIIDDEGEYIPEIEEETDPQPVEDVRKAGGGDENLASSGTVVTDTVFDFPQYSPGQGEEELLARLIWHESGNQPYNGRVAVAEVVMNRVFSPLFPNDIVSVIYQPSQFSYSAEIMGCPITEQNLGIAKRVIAGQERVFGNSEVLYFRNPMITSGIHQSEKVNWGKHTWYAYIGGHTFYTQN